MEVEMRSQAEIARENELRRAEHTLALSDDSGLQNWACNTLASMSSSNSASRRQALKTLQLNPENEKLLLGLLRDSSPEALKLRKPILRKLKGAQSEEAISFLIETLQSTDRSEVRLCFKALAGQKGHGVPETLASVANALAREALQSGKIKKVKHAIKALTYTETDGALAVLGEYAIDSANPLPLRLKALAGLQNSASDVGAGIIAAYLSSGPEGQTSFVEACLDVQEWNIHKAYADQVSHSLQRLNHQLYMEESEEGRSLIFELMGRRIDALHGSTHPLSIKVLESVISGYQDSYASEVRSHTAGKTVWTPLLSAYSEAAFRAIDALAAGSDSACTSALLRLFDLQRRNPLPGDPNIFMHIFRKLLDKQHPDLPSLFVQLAKEALSDQAGSYPLRACLRGIQLNWSQQTEEWIVGVLQSAEQGDIFLREVHSFLNPWPPHAPTPNSLRFSSPHTRRQLIHLLPTMTRLGGEKPRQLKEFLALIGPVVDAQERSQVEKLLDKRSWLTRLLNIRDRSRFVSRSFSDLVRARLLDAP